MAHSSESFVFGNLSEDELKTTQVSTFSGIYSSSSYDVLSGKFNGKTIAETVEELQNNFECIVQAQEVEEAINHYREEWNTKITSFLAISNSVELRYEDGQVVYDNPSVRERWRKYLNLDEHPVWWMLIPLKLIYSGVMILHNLLKGATEAPLAWLADRAKRYAKKCWDAFNAENEDDSRKQSDVEENIAKLIDYTEEPSFLDKAENFFYKTALLAGAGALGIGYVATRGLQLLSRAAISPADSALAAIYTGMDAGESIVNYFAPENEKLKKYFGRWFIGGILGGAFGLFSIATTAIIYAFTFGLLFTGAYAAGFSFAANTGNTVLEFTPGLVKVLLAFSTKVVYPILQSIGLSAVPSLGVGMVSFFGGLIMAGATTLFAAIKGIFNESWYALEPVPQPPVISDNSVTQEILKSSNSFTDQDNISSQNSLSTSIDFNEEHSIKSKKAQQKDASHIKPSMNQKELSNITQSQEQNETNHYVSLEETDNPNESRKIRSERNLTKFNLWSEQQNNVKAKKDIKKDIDALSKTTTKVTTPTITTTVVKNETEETKDVVKKKDVIKEKETIEKTEGIRTETVENKNKNVNSASVERTFLSTQPRPRNLNARKSNENEVTDSQIRPRGKSLGS